MRASGFLVTLSVCTWALPQVSAAQSEKMTANILVSLPADASLTVNGQTTQAASATRRFVTPPLESGKGFYYVLRATFIRDGKTIIVEQKVPVRAGRQSVVSLDVSGTSSAGFAATPGTYQNYYYNMQVPTAPPAAANYAPGYYSPFVPTYGAYDRPALPPSQWVPGGYKTYNP